MAKKTAKKPVTKTTGSGTAAAKGAKKTPLRTRLGSWVSSRLGPRLRRWLKRAVYALVVIVLIPVILVPVYRIEAIKPVSTLMLARWVTFQPVTREWIEIDDIAPALYQSVVMSEDGQFCNHHGVDLGELKAQVELALEGEETRGASTITMQTAKNLFLWNSRSFVRKALELPLAVWIDLVLPKKRIMEIYLNIAEWDDGGIFGAEAGARSHFGKSAANLTRRQAAYMAVTLPNPILREPSRPSSGLTRLARLNEQRAQQSGAYVKCLE